MNELLDIASAADDEPDDSSTYEYKGEEYAGSKRSPEKQHTSREDGRSRLIAEVSSTSSCDHARQETEPRPERGALGFEQDGRNDDGHAL